MNAARQAIWLLLAIVILACSGWYFASSTVPVKMDKQTLAATADIVIHGLTVRQFDAEGHLANHLQTPLLHHIPLNDTNWIKSPRILISQVNQPAWAIRARRAKSIHGGEQVTFIHKVIIHQDKSESSQESTFRTEEITWFPKDKRASTLLDITFEQSGNIIQARGMNAWLEEKRVQLLHQARGSYVPTQG